MAQRKHGYLRLHIVLNTEALTDAFRGAGFEATCLLEATGGPVEHRPATDGASPNRRITLGIPRGIGAADG